MKKIIKYFFSDNFIHLFELVSLSLIVFFGIVYLQDFFESSVYLCDGGSSSEFVADNHVDDRPGYLPTLGLYGRCKRKVSWLLLEKGNDRYRSYSDYKSNYRPSSLWNIVKADFKKSQANAARDRALSERQAADLMSRIRYSLNRKR